MGTPDLVLSMAAPFEIAAEPRSVYGDFPLRTSFTEDKYIRAAEVQPGNRDVTHHANVYVNDDNGSHRIASFSPGTGAKTYPPGVAKLLPAGAVLNLDMHYNPKGRAARDPGTTVALVVRERAGATDRHHGAVRQQHDRHSAGRGQLRTHRQAVRVRGGQPHPVVHAAA